MGELAFVSLGKYPKPESEYSYAHTLFGLLQLCNDYSIAAYPQLKRRWEQADVRPDVVLFDGTFPAAMPFCESGLVKCVVLAPGLMSLALPGSEVDGYPAIISGLSVKDLETSVVARVKNWVLLRVVRYVIPLIRAVMFRSFWAVAGYRIPPLGTPAGSSMMLLSPCTHGIAPPSQTPPLVQWTGPWLPRNGPGLGPDVKRFLDEGPFIYLSLGTNAEWDCAEALKFSNALHHVAKVWGTRVLWSVKDYQVERCKIVSKMQVRKAGGWVLGMRF